MRKTYWHQRCPRVKSLNENPIQLSIHLTQLNDDLIVNIAESEGLWKLTLCIGSGDGWLVFGSAIWLQASVLSPRSV